MGGKKLKIANLGFNELRIPQSLNPQIYKEDELGINIHEMG